MPVLFSETAERDFDGLEPSLRKFFLRHIEKLKKVPPRRHLKFGLPCHVEDVTRQARLVYQADGDTLYILRCFNSHKEYERWYLSFK